jgi:hypothetical protein
MSFCFEKRSALPLLSVLFVLSMIVSCHKPAKSEEGNSQPLSSEPASYSAAIVRLIEAGDERREIVSRIVVAPDKRREEWTENGKRRIAILRFDIGKSYLLDPEHRLYIETDLNQNLPQDKKSSDAELATAAEKEDTSSSSTATEWLTDEFREEPTNVETKTLPDETIAGERCKVTESRARFADGRMEITKVFRAMQLGGLMIKTETESIAENHKVKIITERRDLKFEISVDEFTIPADFKKAQKFSS